jgi:hypothetical protein
MVHFNCLVAIKGMKVIQKEIKAKMDSRLEVKASHKMMEAKIMTNQEQMKVSQEEMKATVSAIQEKTKDNQERTKAVIRNGQEEMKVAILNSV